MSEEALKLAQSISHEIWQTYDGTHGYRSEKQARNATIPTLTGSDPYPFWGQFDWHNHTIFTNKIQALVDNDTFGALELAIWALPLAKQELQMLKDLAAKGIFL